MFSRISVRERLVGLLFVVYVLWSTWAYSGAEVRAKVVAGVLGALVLLAALMPLPRLGASGARSQTGRAGLERLMRLPVFWMGLALVAYITTQNVNESWFYASNLRQWWVESWDHIGWLPSGLGDAPFVMKNGWAVLLVLATPWMALCGVLITVGRRRVLDIIIGCVVGNALLLALYGCWLDADPERTGIFDVPGWVGFGTFVHANSAAAFLNIGVTLALMQFLRALRGNLVRHGPAWPLLLFLAAAVGMSLGVATTISRAGIVILAFLWLAFFLVCALMVFVKHRTGRGMAGFFLATLMLVFAGTGVFQFARENSHYLEVRLERDFLNERVRSGAVSVRAEIYKASWEMFEDRWFYGYGAGSYRFFFLRYQRERAILWNENRERNPVITHAHSDLLHFPIELGVVGCLPLLAFAGWILVVMHQHRAAVDLSLGFGALGLLASVSQAGVSHLLHNPAVLSAVATGVLVLVLLPRFRMEASQTRATLDELDAKHLEKGETPAGGVAFGRN